MATTQQKSLIIETLTWIWLKLKWVKSKTLTTTL